MPEMTFRVRWPDGTEASCYSPSLVMHDYLVEGRFYTVAEFVRRSTEALAVASERVRARYGFECTSALQQTAEIRIAASTFPTGTVEVLSMAPPLPDAAPTDAAREGASA